MKMKMKIIKLAAFIAALFLLMACASSGSSGGKSSSVKSSSGVNTGGASRAKKGGDELDRSIREISDYLNKRIQAGSKVVFLNVKSDWPDLSEYILSGLTENAVNDELFTVVDRQQLDLIRAEQNFQWSGEVSDASAQEIGQMLGAQSIVSGAITTIGSVYRIQMRAIAVQTAAVQGQFSQNVDSKGPIVASLIKRVVPAGSAPAPATASAGGARTQTAAAGGTAQAAPAANSVTPRQPKDGTYTFYPRPVGTKGGINADGWLVKIVIRSGYFNLFLSSKPVGKGTSYGLSFGPPSTLILQDLDNPSKSYNAVMPPRWDEETGSYIITFQNVTSNRLSYIETQPNPPWTIEQIILGEPDK